MVLPGTADGSVHKAFWEVMSPDPNGRVQRSEICCQFRGPYGLPIAVPFIVNIVIAHVQQLRSVGIGKALCKPRGDVIMLDLCVRLMCQ